MTDLNIGDFFADAAKILDWLYRQFPVPQTLYVEDISGADEIDEFGMHSKRHLACHSCLLWLGEEGYLRFGESIRHEAVDQVVLSGRCFTLLATPLPRNTLTAENSPTSIALEHSTPMHALRVAVKQKDSVAIEQAMLGFMQQMEASSSKS